MRSDLLICLASDRTAQPQIPGTVKQQWVVRKLVCMRPFRMKRAQEKTVAFAGSARFSIHRSFTSRILFECQSLELVHFCFRGPNVFPVFGSLAGPTQKISRGQIMCFSMRHMNKNEVLVCISSSSCTGKIASSSDHSALQMLNRC